MTVNQSDVASSESPNRDIISTPNQEPTCHPDVSVVISIPLNDDFPPPVVDSTAPPPYEENDNSFDLTTCETLPPTYEEVQRQKAQEASGDFYPPYSYDGLTDPTGSESSPVGPEGVSMFRLGEQQEEEQLLGTDFMFLVAFGAAFVFNWVGFVLLLCFCHTVAGRTGALAGFGLSLAKWAVIVKHSTDLVAESNTWLLWLIMTLGLLICMRAIMQYMSAKRDWHRVPQNSRQRFFLFY